VADAWKMGTPAERNKVARAVFADVLIDNRTVVAILPRSRLRAFFESALCQVSDKTTLWRKRRGVEPAPSEPERNAMSGSGRGLPTDSLAQSTVAIAALRILTSLVPRLRSQADSRAGVGDPPSRRDQESALVGCGVRRQS
jgi:hypothetical protein